MKWTIVIGTYNQSNYIKPMFDALDNLNDQDFEVRICDDGSDKKQVNLINKLKKPNYHHHWQEKKGFQLAKNLNQGFMAAKGKRTVCFMMDSMPKPDLLTQYDRVFEPGRILVGIRHNVADVDSLRVIDKDWRLDCLEDIDVMYVPWRRFTGNNWCASTRLVQDMNGWNEDYEGYGLEDFEFALRCFKAGYRFTPVLKAIVYHVSHPKFGENEQNQLKWLKYEQEFLKNAKINIDKP